MSTTRKGSRWGTRAASPSKSEVREPYPFLNEGPILLAVRGTQSSEAPAVVASEIASALGRSLRVISAVEPALTYAFPPLIPEGSLVVDEASRKVRETAVNESLTRLLGAESYDLSVALGMPVNEIATASRQLNAALVVVGAAPRVRMNQTVSGRRAGQILQRSGTPVLSVDPALRQLPKQILVATDFSTASVHAAQLSIAFLGKGGRVTLLHVLPAIGTLLPSEPTASVDLREEVTRRLEELRAFLKSEATGEVNIEVAIAEGEPVHEILAHAERINADLIVTGTHGRAGLGRLIVGSTASDILHTAPCSVLASTEPDVAEAMRIELEMGQQVVSHDNEKWSTLLDEFSKRNEGRDVELEVDDPSIGAQIQATGYKLGGASYDGDGRVTVILQSGQKGDTHLTRNIPGVDSVAVSATKGGRDAVLELKHGKGHTLIILRS